MRKMSHSSLWATSRRIGGKRCYTSYGTTVPASQDIAEAILRREGLDPVTDRRQYERVANAVDDWLFNPRGRGAKSGLPD